MAPNDSAHTTEEARDLVAGRRKAARYLVPVGVAGVAAATIGLVPALAASGDPDLPKISAQQLIEKIAASDAQQLSGTMKIKTDLGLPSFGGLGSFAPKGGAGKGGSSASPDSKLMELASGSHTLRVAADGPDKQKLSVLDNASEYSVIHSGADVWAYDSASNEVYHSKRAPGGVREGRPGKAPEALPATPKALAEQALKAVDPTTSVTVDGTSHVAGRDAYQLVIKPKQSGSTIGAIRIAVDAKNGVPLKFTLAPSGGGKAVIDAGFAKVDFGKPSASTFDFTPPKGAKVTQDDGKGHEGKGHDGRAHGGKDLKGSRGEEFKGLNVIGKGWNSIARLDVPGGKGIPSAPSGKGGKGDVPPEARKFLDSLGDKVTGKFGSGTVFKTRLINALVTDDGKVYVGAVNKDALVNAANAAK
ncbi:outer membrane lipoprotein carrier protein LolA [Streptomyces sp. NPDC058301]|uniref:LolA family protein n=1 Tax=Streptomyces sp. NPDC058301 TaxID=3346436 RepID=UPI0036E430C5